MRKLKKGLPIQVYSNFIKINKPKLWSDFSGQHKSLSQEVRLHILCDEQNEMCGYTELPISDPFDCEIDHYKKRDLFSSPRDVFDWNNFVVATKDDDFGARYKDLHYGIQKTDYGSFLDPVTDVPEACFDYTLTGDIEPKSSLGARHKALAKKTIDVFNLNNKSLKNRRSTIIAQMQSYSDLSDTDILDCFGASGFKSLVEQLLRER